MTTSSRNSKDPDPGAWGLPSLRDLEGLGLLGPGLSPVPGGAPGDPGGGGLPPPPWHGSALDPRPPEGALPETFNPESQAAWGGLPDLRAPEAAAPRGARPQDLGSARSLPDLRAPEAAAPWGARPQDLGSARSLPDLRAPEAAVTGGAAPADPRSAGPPESPQAPSGACSPTVDPLPPEDDAAAEAQGGARLPRLEALAAPSWNVPGILGPEPFPGLAGLSLPSLEAASSTAPGLPAGPAASGLLDDGSLPQGAPAPAAPLGSGPSVLDPAAPGAQVPLPAGAGYASDPAAARSGAPWIPSSLGLEALGDGSSSQYPWAAGLPAGFEAYAPLAAEMLRLAGASPRGDAAVSPQVKPEGGQEKAPEAPGFPRGAPGAAQEASPETPKSGAPAPAAGALPASGGGRGGAYLLRPVSEGGHVRPLPYVGAVPVSAIREDFPILSEKVEGGRDLVWFDNAATTQKPKAVIDRLAYYYSHENSNVHRGAHALAARATEAYEEARLKAARFIGARSENNIVFVRGTTEAVNLAAQAFAKPRLSPGDEIMVSVLEHHANIVPWQQAAQETGALIRVIPVDDTGQILYGEYLRLFSPRTRLVAIAHVSNALGTVTPISALAAAARARGVPILVDGAQSVSHLPVDVSALGVDFFAFSGHKIYGPTGIGCLYGTDEAFAEARPYQTGGNMIADVTFERTLYRPPPQKFEAGTANIAGAVGLGAALDYVSRLGIHNIAAYEEALLRYATGLLSEIPGVTLVGTAACKASVLSFTVEGRAIEEVGSRLSAAGIAVRAGHHCAQPIVRRFGLEGTVRASLAFYNTPEEVDYFASIVREAASAP